MPHWEHAHPWRTRCHGVIISLIGISGSSRRSCWIWFRAGVWSAPLQTPHTKSHLHTAYASCIRKGEEHLLLPHNSYHCLSLKEYTGWIFPQKTYLWARRMSRPSHVTKLSAGQDLSSNMCLSSLAQVFSHKQSPESDQHTGFQFLLEKGAAECKPIVQILALWENNCRFILLNKPSL